jgi:hypothetical protein
MKMMAEMRLLPRLPSKLAAKPARVDDEERR